MKTKAASIENKWSRSLKGLFTCLFICLFNFVAFYLWKKTWWNMIELYWEVKTSVSLGHVLEHSYNYNCRCRNTNCALGIFSNLNIKSWQVSMCKSVPKLVVSFGDMVESLGDRTSLAKLGHWRHGFEGCTCSRVTDFLCPVSHGVRNSCGQEILHKYMKPNSHGLKLWADINLLSLKLFSWVFVTVMRKITTAEKLLSHRASVKPPKQVLCKHNQVCSRFL